MLCSVAVWIVSSYGTLIPMHIVKAWPLMTFLWNVWQFKLSLKMWHVQCVLHTTICVSLSWCTTPSSQGDKLHVFAFRPCSAESSRDPCQYRYCSYGYCNQSTGGECVCYDGWEGPGCNLRRWSVVHISKVYTITNVHTLHVSYVIVHVQ